MALHETCYSRKAWLILIAIIIILRSIPHYQFDIFQNPVPTNPPSASTSTTSRQLTLVGPPITLHPSPGAQTYPRAIKLRSGVFLGVVTTFEPQNGILVSISNDSGASWSPHSTIMLAPEPNVQLNNAFLLETSTNRILCAFRCHTLKPEAIGVDEKPGGLNEGYLYYKLLLYYSDDLGITWHYLSTPVQESGPVHGLWEPFLRLSNKGDLQFYYSREAGNRDQDNLLRISKDGGLTWSTEVFVSGSGLATRDGMMGIQELEAGSGKLMSVFESVEEKGDSFEGRFSLWNTFSSDDGHSWGYRRLLYESYWNKPTEHSIKRNAGAPSIALVGSTLVVSFMTDDVELRGMWHRNACVKIMTSDDGGHTWNYPFIIAEMPAAWAGILVINETDFLVLCEHNSRAEARHVSFMA